MTICEICDGNEADFESHCEEHVPNPREIDVCNGCHSKIYSSWKWILRKEPRACPLHAPLSDPDELRNKHGGGENSTAGIEDGVCWYPNYHCKKMAESGKSRTNHHPCSEIEEQYNIGEKNFDYKNCHIFSQWYRNMYFKTLGGLDDG